jgi:cell division protein FtsB
MRLLIGFLTLALVLLQYRLWLSEDGLREVWQLEDEVVAQTAHNSDLADLNAALEAEVLDLKQGLAAAEERARSELGMVGNDETFFQIMPSASE